MKRIVAALILVASPAFGQEAVPTTKQGLLTRYSCETLRAYLATHSEADARAKAKELKLPAWLVRRAERCPRKD